MMDRLSYNIPGDSWQRACEREDDSETCNACKHPVWRHYGSAPGIERLCSCGCTNWSRSTMDIVYARYLPEGTRVEHDGQIWVAWPPAEICGQLIRWHSEASLASDRGMDAMLDDGAKVLGE